MTAPNFYFFIRKSKSYKDDTNPLYLRLTINGERADISLKIGVYQSDWDKKAQRVKGYTKNAKRINAIVESYLSNVYDAIRILNGLGQPYTVNELRDKILGKEETRLTLLDFFEQQLSSFREKMDIDYSKATIKKYETTLRHIEDYLKYDLKNEAFLLDKVNHGFVTGFEDFLKTKKKINHNSTMKYQAQLKKVLRMGLHNDLIKKNPYANYKISTKKNKVEYLTETEVLRIKDHDFNNDRLNRVRDIFVFCCFTGLAYVDIKSLEMSHIELDGDNKQILKPREKTGELSRVPLLPTAESILNRYKDHPERLLKNKALPVLSNQKMNSYLKEIADRCEINKPLTTHIARHTFATLALSHGVPLKTVSQILGHSSVKMTEHYAKLTDKKLHEDMKKFGESF